LDPGSSLRYGRDDGEVELADFRHRSPAPVCIDPAIRDLPAEARF
jgi:hypothetical protein